MRSLLIVMLTAMVTTSPAWSQEPISFQGTGFIVGVNGAECTPSGLIVGNDFLTSYWPKGNGNNFASAFSFVFRRSAISFESNSGGGRLATSGHLEVFGVAARGYPYGHESEYKAFSITPPENRITVDTEFVDVEGTIVDYDKTDCDVTFRAGYARRP